jgi:hypothetical protein
MLGVMILRACEGEGGITSKVVPPQLELKETVV